MKIIRIADIALVLTGLSNAAVAQMGGQGPRGAGNGAGMSGAGGMGGPGGPGMAGEVVVASDGKALLVKRTPTASGSTTTTTTQLVAISTAGTVAWTWTPPAEIRDLALPTGLVVVTAVTPGTSTAAPAAQLVALNLASGSQAWSLPVDGMIQNLEVTSTGLLGIVSKYVAATGTATQGTVSRSLVSVNLSGSIFWTLVLD